MTKIIPLLVLTLLINSCCTKKNINNEESEKNQNIMVLNGNWKVSKLIGMDKLKVNPTLNFDSEKLNVGGKAGCNSYGTEFTIEGDQIKFGIPNATKMMCTNMNIEKAFFSCLQKASSYKIIDGELKFYSKDGEEQMTCHKAEE